ncbi:unnamed protein product [Paramecium pentaurelia]|uniref:Transmembrane protein n=1 Tax=Paramecium pentaurelia TaxID=43138 RepID=A0A8S1T1M5_9CILI|nr:unnamed protein product [Paramecium pentaurelia]
MPFLLNVVNPKTKEPNIFQLKIKGKLILLYIQILLIQNIFQVIIIKSVGEKIDKYCIIKFNVKEFINQKDQQSKIDNTFVVFQLLYLKNIIMFILMKKADPLIISTFHYNALYIFSYQRSH